MQRSTVVLSVLLAETLYFFGDNNFTEWGPLFQKYTPPPFRIPGTTGAYSFGIAGQSLGHQRDGKAACTWELLSNVCIEGV